MLIFFGCKFFWTVLNNQLVEDGLYKVNGRRKTTSILLDISTLYTKIPHDKLLKVLNELLCFSFFFHEHSRITGLEGKGEGIS